MRWPPPSMTRGVDFVLSRPGQTFGPSIVGYPILEPMVMLTLYRLMARWFPQMRARRRHWLPSSSCLFPSLPTSRDSRQAAIDFAWGTHRPPGNRNFVEVSLTEVRDAVKAMPLAFAPGLDHIPVVVLCKNLFILAPWLRLIYSASLSLQYFPRIWRVAKVIVLRKPGKASYSTPRSYRPISLRSHLGKGLERIVNRRLMHDLESHQVFSPY